MFDVLKNSIKQDLLAFDPEQVSSVVGKFWRMRGFRFVCLMRLARYSRDRKILGYPIRLLYRLYSDFANMEIPLGVDIGESLYVPHLGGVVINKHARLGRGVYLSHNVTIGRTHRGKRSGVPTIGNHVYLGSGAVCVGNIQIGDYAVIGPNVVVTKDVPSCAVLVSGKSTVISDAGSFGIAPLAAREERVCRHDA